jgi:hypothetical protein
VRTLERLYAERSLTFDVHVDAAHVVGGQREDLDEMLGNLMDNACKWARSRVTVSSRLDGAQIAIEVDDDGPGLDSAMLDAVMRRGVRADEAVPGSGLGLAIVRDSRRGLRRLGRAGPLATWRPQRAFAAPASHWSTGLKSCATCALRALHRPRRQHCTVPDTSGAEL